MAKNAKMKYKIETAYTIDGSKLAGAYRKGVGKPEGIVLHENGNHRFPSLEQEISYMTRNAQNAYTHAWNDNTRIVEIANTDYACWGAGRYANPKYAQIEVLRMKDPVKARKAIDRGLFWGAFQLYWYDLPCIDATKTGKGTVWTHEAVSRLLGGTDHVDPIGFWASVGITWDMAFAKLKEYYDALHAGDSTKVADISLKSSSKSVSSSTPDSKVAGAKVSSKGDFSGIEKSYNESGSFRTNDAILVRDIPSTKGTHIATYNKGEVLDKYHRVHIGNGYVWLQYTRGGNKGQGYLPIRTYNNGVYGSMWGEIGEVGAFNTPLKTYVDLAHYVTSWRIYPLGVQPVAGNEMGFLNPAQYGGLTYELLGYEDNGKTAVINTTYWGKGKIWLDGDAKIYKA